MGFKADMKNFFSNMDEPAIMFEFRKSDGEAPEVNVKLLKQLQAENAELKRLLKKTKYIEANYKLIEEKD